MELIAASNRYVKTDERGSFVTKKGEPFSIDVSSQKNREKVVMMMQSLFAYPANYPEQVAINVKRNYHISLPGMASVSGSVGEQRTLPRMAALYLITHEFATPVDENLWSYELAPETPEDKIRKLHSKEEAAEVAAEERKADNWFNRWKKGR